MEPIGIGGGRSPIVTVFRSMCSGNLMHWPAVERVWLPEWLNQRLQTIARLRKAVDEAKQRPVQREVDPVPARPAPEPRPAPAAPKDFAPLKSAPAPARPARPKQHPMIQTYSEYVPQRLGDVDVLDQISGTWASTRVTAAISDAIEAEGPIHRDRLARLVANAFGLNRVNADRRHSIQRMVPSEYRRNTGEPFYWPKDVDSESWHIVRRPAEGTSRSLEEVSLIEIVNAMMIVAEQSGGIDGEELKREALALFGGRRVTPAIGGRLDQAFERGVAKGLLSRSSGGTILRISS